MGASRAVFVSLAWDRSANPANPWVRLNLCTGASFLRWPQFSTLFSILLSLSCQNWCLSIFELTGQSCRNASWYITDTVSVLNVWMLNVYPYHAVSDDSVRYCICHTPTATAQSLNYSTKCSRSAHQTFPSTEQSFQDFRVRKSCVVPFFVKSAGNCFSNSICVAIPSLAFSLINVSTTFRSSCIF